MLVFKNAILCTLLIINNAFNNAFIMHLLALHQQKLILRTKVGPINTFFFEMLLLTKRKK